MLQKIEEKQKQLQDTFYKICPTLYSPEIAFWKERFQTYKSSIKQKAKAQVIKEMEEDLTNFQERAHAELEEFQMEQDLTNFQEMAIAKQQEKDNLNWKPSINTDEGAINELLFGDDWLHLNVVVDKEHSKSYEGEHNPNLKSIGLIDGIHNFESDSEVNPSEFANDPAILTAGVDSDSTHQVYHLFQGIVQDSSMIASHHQNAKERFRSLESDHLNYKTQCLLGTRERGECIRSHGFEEQ